MVLNCAVDVGSMSSEERKEVLSRSFLVLVIVRNESKRLFWSFFGVPLRSRIYHISHGREHTYELRMVIGYLLEVRKGCIPNE